MENVPQNTRQSLDASLLLGKKLGERHIQARHQIDHGIYTCKQVSNLAERMASLCHLFSFEMKQILKWHTAHSRQEKIMRDESIGAQLFWNSFIDLFKVFAEQNQIACDKLKSDIVHPLNALQKHLKKERKFVNSFRREKSFDVAGAQQKLTRDKKRCLKILNALQQASSHVPLSSYTIIPSTTPDDDGQHIGESDSKTSPPHIKPAISVFQRLTNRRRQHVIAVKTAEAKKAFKKYSTDIDRMNLEISSLENGIVLPVLYKVNNLEQQRLQVLHDSTVSCQDIICTSINTEVSKSFDACCKVLEKSLHHLQNDAERLDHCGGFVYDLPCTPEAFDANTWPRLKVETSMMFSKTDTQDSDSRENSCSKSFLSHNKTLKKDEIIMWNTGETSLHSNESSENRGYKNEQSSSSLVLSPQPSSMNRESSNDCITLSSRASFELAQSMVADVIRGQKSTRRNSSTPSFHKSIPAISSHNEEGATESQLQHPQITRVRSTFSRRKPLMRSFNSVEPKKE